MVFLSNLQVTAFWITNLSLNLSSFLFHTPALVYFFLSTLKFPKIESVKHSFIEAQLLWIEIEHEIHTLTFSYSAPSTES